MGLMNLRGEYILDPPKEVSRAIHQDLQGRAAQNWEGRKEKWQREREDEELRESSLWQDNERSKWPYFYTPEDGQMTPPTPSMTSLTGALQSKIEKKKSSWNVHLVKQTVYILYKGSGHIHVRDKLIKS